MHLHVFRHGLAASRDEAGVADDAKRPLTDAGTDQTVQQADGVTRLVGDLDSIATSPYRRAQQTARILADAFGIPHGEIHDLDVLAPDRDPGKALEAIWQRFDGDVAVVGHRPQLPRLASTALAGDPDAVSVRLGTASLLTVEITDAGSELVRLVEPPTLRALAGTL